MNKKYKNYLNNKKLEFLNNRVLQNIKPNEVLLVVEGVEDLIFFEKFLPKYVKYYVLGGAGKLISATEKIKAIPNKKVVLLDDDEAGRIEIEKLEKQNLKSIYKHALTIKDVFQVNGMLEDLLNEFHLLDDNLFKLVRHFRTGAKGKEICPTEGKEFDSKELGPNTLENRIEIEKKLLVFIENEVYKVITHEKTLELIKKHCQWCVDNYMEKCCALSIEPAYGTRVWKREKRMKCSKNFDSFIKFVFTNSSSLVAFKAAVIDTLVYLSEEEATYLRKTILKFLRDPQDAVKKSTPNKVKE